MIPEPTTEHNALAHAFLAMMDASTALAHAALLTIEAEDLRRITGIAGADWLTPDLWQAVEHWRDAMMDLEPILPYIGAALATSHMKAGDLADAQALAALSAPAAPAPAIVAAPPPVTTAPPKRRKAQAKGAAPESLEQAA